MLCNKDSIAHVQIGLLDVIFVIAHNGRKMSLIPLVYVGNFLYRKCPHTVINGGNCCKCEPDPLNPSLARQAVMVARIAKNLVREGMRPGDIGVITPYAAQIPTIR